MNSSQEEKIQLLEKISQLSRERINEITAEKEQLSGRYKELVNKVEEKTKSRLFLSEKNQTLNNGSLKLETEIRKRNSSQKVKWIRSIACCGVCGITAAFIFAFLWFLRIAWDFHPERKSY